jgi:alanyl-tRNA synthetase
MDVLTAIQNEEEKFEGTLEKGLKEFNRFVLSTEPQDKYGRIGVAWSQGILYGKDAFYLYQSFGFPKELMEEICKEKDIRFDEEGFKEALKEHQEISRIGAEKKFGGGGEFSPKLHTAAHLLHAALRKVLGEHVKQMGSDITAQRLRFDFSHPQKMTEEEIKKVEDLVNQKIKEDLEVKKEEMSYENALKSGALAFFKEKYPGKVSVYSIGDFSKEICAGPHINKTGKLGQFKIIKEESSGAGIRRIRAILQ